MQQSAMSHMMTSVSLCKIPNGEGHRGERPSGVIFTNSGIRGSEGRSGAMKRNEIAELHRSQYRIRAFCPAHSQSFLLWW
jgi:hypothetical protein